MGVGYIICLGSAKDPVGIDGKTIIYSTRKEANFAASSFGDASVEEVPVDLIFNSNNEPTDEFDGGKAIIREL